MKNNWIIALIWDIDVDGRAYRFATDIDGKYWASSAYSKDTILKLGDMQEINFYTDKEYNFISEALQKILRAFNEGKLGSPTLCLEYYPNDIETCICTSWDIFNYGCASTKGKRCNSR